MRRGAIFVTFGKCYEILTFSLQSNLAWLINKLVKDLNKDNLISYKV